MGEGGWAGGNGSVGKSQQHKCEDPGLIVSTHIKAGPTTPALDRVAVEGPAALCQPA